MRKIRSLVRGGSSALQPIILAIPSVPRCIRRGGEHEQEARARERRRRAAICGGYRLRDSAERSLEPVVTLVGVGAVMPEVIRAAKLLEEEGAIGAVIVCLTSPDLVFRAWRAVQGLGEGKYGILDELFSPERALPIVSVMDSHPHALSCLGVTEFGQSGDVEPLYEHHGIDVETSSVPSSTSLADLGNRRR
jgi:pyruvate dehydrogenase E1 component